MDSDQLFEYCYASEDETKAFLQIALTGMLDFTSRVSQLENSLSVSLGIVSTLTDKAIDDYWDLYKDMLELQDLLSRHHYNAVRNGFGNQYDLLYNALESMREGTAYYICCIMEHTHLSVVAPLTKPTEHQIIKCSNTLNKKTKACMQKLNSIRF